MAMELGDVFLILDDRKASACSPTKSKVIGTVGMLLRAKGKGIITEIKPLLAALNQAVFAFQSHYPECFTNCWGTLIPGVLQIYVKQPNTG